MQKRRNKPVAKRFFKHVLATCPEESLKIVTGQLRSHPAAKAEIRELVMQTRIGQHAIEC